jgi:glycosyltransferase involved in cell wall biosynthesis
MKKLLIVSSNSIHLFNFYNLINSYFDYIDIATDSINNNFDYKNSNLYKFNFSIKKPFKFFLFYFNLKKLLKTNKYSLIHIQQISTAALITVLATKKTKTPIVLTAWGSDVLLTPHKGFFYRKMVKYVINNSNICTADAEYVIQEIKKITKKNIPVKQVILSNIHNPPDSLPEKEKIIYSNRLLKSIYRIDEIIYAFERFLKNSADKNWQLIIAGDGDDKARLEYIVENRLLGNNVKFVGWLSKEKNYEYYSKAKLYVSIPISDGTPTSLLEAMSFGCIPVVSDLPAYHEWIKNKVNGLIINDLNTNFLDEALKIDNINAWQINRNILLQKATIDVNKIKFIDIYNELINK